MCDQSRLNPSFQRYLKKGNSDESFKLMGKPAATYKTELNSSHGLAGSRCTPLPWTTFYDN